MELTLPKSQQRTFESISFLDEKTHDRLFEILKSEPLSIDLDRLGSRFADELGVSEQVAQNIIWMLHHMYFATVENELSPDVFSEQICRSAKDAKLEIDDAALERTSRFLKRVLTLDETLGVVSKALSLLRDRERVFSEARIVTDYRPIFRKSLEQLPSAAVITHTLRITFNEDGSSVSLFVGMDGEDLEALKECVERAMQKQATLARAFPSVPCVT